jgi:hypothetical protein
VPLEIKEHVTTCVEDYVPMNPWISPEGLKGYIPVPKVASSTMTRALSHENRWTRRPVPDECEMFALIRHPINRWISGMTEIWNPILVRRGNDLSSLKDMIPEELFTYSDYDRHVVPQHWNFQTYTNITLFKFEHLHKVWEWLGMPHSSIWERNNLTMGGLQREIKEVVRSKALHKKLVSLYQTDLELWKKAI